MDVNVEGHRARILIAFPVPAGTLADQREDFKDLTMKPEIKDRRAMLRVKLKSLAEESKIIRKEEFRVNSALREELHQHRVGVVRYEARATHLAYGLIRGRTLERIENSKTRTEPLWKKVQAMIEKYGPVDRAQMLERCKG